MYLTITANESFGLYYNRGYFHYIVGDKVFRGSTLRLVNHEDSTDWVMKYKILAPLFNVNLQSSQILVLNFESRSIPDGQGHYNVYYEYMFYQRDMDGNFMQLFSRLGGSILGKVAAFILRVPIPTGKINNNEKIPELPLLPLDSITLSKINWAFDGIEVIDYGHALEILNGIF